MTETNRKQDTMDTPGARELLLQTASAIMREGDLVDIPCRAFVAFGAELGAGEILFR
jgi:hypothetical protein